MLCALRDGQLDVNYLRGLRRRSLGSEWLAVEISWADFATTQRRPSPAMNAFEDFRVRLQTRTASTSPSAWIVHLTDRAALQPEAPGKSEFIAAFRECFENYPTVGLRATPAPQRLPSEREQRQAFINSRFDPEQMDDHVSG
jgi:hypothetical protein